MNNELMEKIKNITMTSLEIAKLTRKDHFHVIRDIEDQLGQLKGGVSRFGDTYQNPQNKQFYKMYRLPRREVLILVSGYSVALREKIIDRLAELEDIVKYGKAIPRNFPAALKALAAS